MSKQNMTNKKYLNNNKRRRNKSKIILFPQNIYKKIAILLIFLFKEIRFWPELSSWPRLRIQGVLWGEGIII